MSSLHHPIQKIQMIQQLLQEFLSIAVAEIVRIVEMV
jgi:hypothetical protein